MQLKKSPRGGQPRGQFQESRRGKRDSLCAEALGIYLLSFQTSTAMGTDKS
jgi:hypothetical protein